MSALGDVSPPDAFPPTAFGGFFSRRCVLKTPDQYADCIHDRPLIARTKAIRHPANLGTASAQ